MAVKRGVLAAALALLLAGGVLPDSVLPEGVMSRVAQAQIAQTLSAPAQLAQSQLAQLQSAQERLAAAQDCYAFRANLHHFAQSRNSDDRYRALLLRRHWYDVVQERQQALGISRERGDQALLETQNRHADQIRRDGWDAYLRRHELRCR